MRIYFFVFAFIISGCSKSQTINGGAGSTISINGVGRNATINKPPTESPYNITTSNQRIVDDDGIIGVNCDYNTITEAEADITDATVNNQYTLRVKDGFYDETGSFSGAFGIYVGITLKHYIHIVGESKTGVIIKGPEAPLESQELLVDAFHIPASCLIKNVTILTENNKYAIHADHNAGNYVYNLWLEDVVLHHLGARGPSKYDVGIGFWKEQQIHIRRLTSLGGGIFVHGTASTNRDVTKPWHLSVYNSTMVDEFHFIDYIEYAGQTVTLTNNTINAAFINGNASIYDANPGVPACNQGFKVFTTFFNSNNTVGSVTQNAEATAILGGIMDFN